MNAVRLMYAGSVLAVASAAGVFTSSPILAIAGGLLSVGAWLWVAGRTRRGRRGTRGLAVIFLALITLGVLGGYADRSVTYLTLLSAAAEWGVGLVAVVLLWRRSATWYFTELRRAL